MSAIDLVVAALLLSAFPPGAARQSAVPRGWAVFGDGTKVRVEIADTPQKRERGLMFRERLAPNEGMVFVFDRPGFYPFWMKNTLIRLDIVWLDAAGRIVSIAASVPPCQADPCPTYPPAGNAMFVVELASGFARDHGLKAGDTVTLEGVPPKGT
jgi:uncharacterized membrane protein (UPF0127 family)